MRPFQVSRLATLPCHSCRLGGVKLACVTSSPIVRYSSSSSSHHEPPTTTLSASPPLAPCATSPVWIEAVQHFYRVLEVRAGDAAIAYLGSEGLTSSSHVGQKASTASVHAAACTAMQLCLQHGRSAEALDVYVAACEEGLPSVGLEPSPPRTAAANIHRLALDALRTVPHRSHQRRVVAQLLAAEGVGAGPAAADDPRHPARLTAVSVAEDFRVQLRQQLGVLRTTRQLRLPLGRNYLLTQAQRALDDHRLRREVEVDPLLQLSSALLWHPFSYATPSLRWARRQGRLETLAHTVSTSGMSPIQRRRILEMEAAVAPVRRVCTHTLQYLTTLAPQWDALVARRVAEVLLLPEDARSIFPPDYRAKRQRARRAGSGARQLLAGGNGDAAWTDAAHRLFDPPVPAHEAAEAEAGGVGALDRALARASRILARRVFPNIIVPDAAFVLQHLQQLLQLGRHREIVLPHGVLLALARLAATTRDPKRFHARRALHALMQQTTTSDTPRLETAVRRGGAHSVAARHVRQRGGVTLLGLQDELALLERCPERTLLEDALGAAADRFDDDAGLPLGGRAAAGVGDVSATLVALQVGRLVAAPPGARQRPSSLSEVDALVAAIVQSNAPAAAVAPSEVPLFKTRSRAYWARMPVVLATTSDSTRAIAHMMGVRMYPPVEG
ncbi:hypothetical protein STCU_09759 [Strigomonas culicis]|uniref:Uncharacterized protein n=1 Tax=Strigomonas culicis TaxID=28005 RepID=S9TKT2_9TRYP|nr:hypothetical protein STCU_09759 [Strigomonas culicis]|eukprot:EPY18817.1 hypothetical protein STCU_09759 [Strigomonas culicis]